MSTSPQLEQQLLDPRQDLQERVDELAAAPAAISRDAIEHLSQRVTFLRNAAT